MEERRSLGLRTSDRGGAVGGTWKEGDIYTKFSSKPLTIEKKICRRLCEGGWRNKRHIGCGAKQAWGTEGGDRCGLSVE